MAVRTVRVSADSASLETPSPTLPLALLCSTSPEAEYSETSSRSVMPAWIRFWIVMLFTASSAMLPSTCRNKLELPGMSATKMLPP